MEKTTCEITLVVDENGDYIADADSDTALENSDGELSGVRRVFTLKITVPLPAATVLSGEVTAPEGGEIALTVEPQA